MTTTTDCLGQNKLATRPQATSTMDSKSAFRTTTDAIVCCRDKLKVTQYFGCIEKVENSLTAASWSVGDLCSFDNDSARSSSSTDAMKNRSSSASPSVQEIQSRSSIGQILALYVSRSRKGQCIYGAHVRKLLQWRESLTTLNGKAIQQLKERHQQKVEHILVETFDTEEIELNHVWDIKVCLNSECTSKQLGLRRPKGSTGVWSFSQVVGQLKKRKFTLLPHPNDWESTSSVEHIPPPLRRGWDCLNDDALRRALLDKPTVSGDGLDRDTHSKAMGTNQTMQSVSPSTNALPSSKSGTKRTPTRALERQSSSRKRHRTQKSSDYTESSPVSIAKHSSNEHHPVPIPISSVAHYLRTAKSIKVTNPLRFYTEVQVPTDTSTWTIKSDTAPTLWSIAVCDLLVVACDKVDTKTKMSWHPFAVPWFVGQVLSLYEEVTEGDSNKWWMEIRWFYHPSDLSSLEIDPPDNCRDNSLIESDEHVDTLPLSAALGRALISSTPVILKGHFYLDDSGIPVMPFLCNHMHMLRYDDRVLRDISDWDGYGSTWHGPLSRGITCEKAWPGRKDGKKLQKSYIAFLSKRYKIKDFVTSNKQRLLDDPDETPSRSSSLICSNELKSDVVVHPDQQLSKSDSTGPVFFRSVVINPKQHGTCGVTSRARKAKSFTITVGDCVCLADTHSDCKPESIENALIPYSCPWSIVQILAVYVIPPVEGTSNVNLEVRKFVRPQELPSSVQSCIPTLLQDEIFETEAVEADVHANRILCRCAVVGAQQISGTSNNETDAIQRRLRFMYLSRIERFFPIVARNHRNWIKGMIERGLRSSSFVLNDVVFTELVESYTSANTSRTPFETLFTSLRVDQVQPEPLSGDLLLSVPIAPQWDALARPDLICPHDDRSNLRWFVRLGDVVVARSTPDLDESSQWFPFRVSWRPCQVLVLYQSPNGSPSKAKVRWLSFDVPEPYAANCCTLYDPYGEGKEEVATIDTTDLLGPVSLTNYPVTSSFFPRHPEFLPLTAMRLVVNSSQGTLNGSQDARNSIVVRAVHDCPEYSTAQKVQILMALGIEEGNWLELIQCARTGPESSQAKKDILPLSPPVLVDPGTGVKFYASLSIKRRGGTNLDSLLHQWQNCSRGFAMGDTVAVRWPVAGLKKSKGATTEPFGVPWRAAEIVTIFENRDAYNNSRPLDAPNAETGLKVEVRWFYHPNELPHSFRSRVSTGAGKMDEVFETDDFATICPSSIIAHIFLQHSVLKTEKTPGIQPETFLCRQFWFRRRNSLLPTISLEGRINRGRAHSYYFGKFHALQDAWDRLKAHEGSAIPPCSHESRVAAFQKVIEKLSLTDASKETLHHASGIIGRESERKFVEDFLRAAINGPTSEGTHSPTLFVAGPPGVGKTACVRSTINEVRNDVDESKPSEIEFFILNGMELRQPSDAYSKLWEDISPDKERCSPERAASRLECYFTGNDEFGNRCSESGRVLVLLVDELDYLVTKKESVLYDLFDWPLRTRQNVRLVVIGVSNTLNLPERLHPRVQSRIGAKRCYFKSYNQKEIAAIVKAKVNLASPDCPVFDEDAITFVSKKIAALSGDVRKAFRICRSATEALVSEWESGEKSDLNAKVCIKDVVRICRESFNSAQAHGISICSPFEALFLVALASLSRWTGRERGGFDLEEILAKMEAMSNALGNKRYIPAPSLEESLDVMSRLSEQRLISLRSPQTASLTYHQTSLTESGGPWPLVSLVVDDAALLVALKETGDKDLARTFLAQQGKA